MTQTTIRREQIEDIVGLRFVDFVVVEPATAVATGTTINFSSSEGANDPILSVTHSGLSFIPKVRIY